MTDSSNFTLAEHSRQRLPKFNPGDVRWLGTKLVLPCCDTRLLISHYHGPQILEKYELNHIIGEYVSSPFSRSCRNRFIILTKL
jgi:hypothetical protein